MSRHKMSEADARRALAAGMLAGFELGYDAACRLLESMEEGEGSPGWAPELRKMKAHQLETARKTVDEMAP